jgi:hypothetical protein
MAKSTGPVRIDKQTFVGERPSYSISGQPLGSEPVKQSIWLVAAILALFGGIVLLFGGGIRTLVNIGSALRGIPQIVWYFVIGLIIYKLFTWAKK